MLIYISNRVKHFHISLCFSCYNEESPTDKLSIIAAGKFSMLSAFSLELWLDWFNDEMHLIALPSQKMYVEELFEKAVKDYMSEFLWMNVLVY